VTTDQRHKPRPDAPGTPCDSGGFEVQSVCEVKLVGGLAYTTADATAVQQALNAAPSSGGVIRIGSWCRSAGSVVANVTKSVTIEGGYSSDNWDTPDPANVTGLDGAGLARVIVTNSGTTVTLRNLRITGGSAPSLSGGGIRASGALLIEGCTITSNSAAMGAGIYAESALNVTGSTISQNTASGRGGGIEATSSANISSSFISSNTAPYGAGISLYSSSGAAVGSVTYSLISSNTSTNDGAGIYVYGISSTVTVRSSTLASNSALGAGGALFTDFETSGGTISYSTLVSNSATGAGDMVFAYNNAVAVTGTIFGTSGRDCVGIADIGYNIDAGTACGLTAASSLSGTDPKLQALGNYGGPTQTYRLKAESPAINRGVPDYVPPAGETDQRGQPRVSSGRIDIGAVEVNALCWATFDNGTTVYMSEDEDAVQAAANAATTGNKTVKVAGTCRTVAGSGNILAANNDVTIEGGYLFGSWQISDPKSHPTILDAAGSGRAVYVPGGKTVTLRKLNITGGYADLGGGIYNAGTLHVISCNIYGNTVNGPYNYKYGAGLYNIGTAIVESTAIYDNRCRHYGGGIANRGAGSTLQIANSTISGNCSGCGFANQYRGGGGLFNELGTVTIAASTFVDNTAWNYGGANFHVASGVSTTIKGTIVKASSGDNCNGDLLSGGYNAISNNDCIANSEVKTGDQKGVAFQLDPLDYNGGLTKNHLPQANGTNSILDKIPVGVCDEMLSGTMVDQRGRTRPRMGWTNQNAWCDMGSVERGQETWTVCGPPLVTSAENPNPRCRFSTVTEALSAAADEDTILVSGVVTDHPSIDRSITLRGPTTAESTPGTHMGFLQGGATKPAAGCTPSGSVVTIESGTVVKIEDLNIRYGCAENGGGVNNNGTLWMKRSTVYDNVATSSGGGINNAGDGEVNDSTLAGNVAVNGGGINNTGTMWVRRATLSGNTASGSGGTLRNTTTGTLRVGGSLLAGTAASSCDGAIEGGVVNLVYGLTCEMVVLEGGSGLPVTADPKLGELRNNGGPTLTVAIPADSPAVDTGYDAGSEYCAGQNDQRGRSRPYDTANAPPLPAEDMPSCDIGAYEYGPRTLTVDAAVQTNRSLLLYQDVQTALNDAFAGDAVALRAGAYTGNFLAFHDGTIRHADVDVSKLSPEMGYDLRAILQASEKTIPEQKRLNAFAGTVLTVQGYAPTGETIVPTGDIALTLSGLTIRHGSGSLGGGIYNAADLRVERSTIESNVAVNQPATGTVVTKGQGGAIYNKGNVTVRHSTISGNIAEYYGGAIYSTAGDGGVSVDIEASTLAGNKAGPIPQQWVVQVTNSVLSPSALPASQGEVLRSGDEIRFENQTGQAHTMTVQPLPAGVTCEPMSVTVPLLGAGLSNPITCSTSGAWVYPNTATISITDVSYPYLQLTLTLTPSEYTPGGASIYQQGNSQTTLDRSIVFTTGAIANCGRADASSHVVSAGSNVLRPETVGGVANKSTCTDVVGDIMSDPLLGPLQDNNQIDYGAGTVSGYAQTHALLPGSPAIDAHDKAAWASTHVQSMGWATNRTSPVVMSVAAGDMIGWTSTTRVTVAFQDGESSEQLLDLIPGAAAIEIQYTEVSSQPVGFRVYDPVTREQVGWGTIEVTPSERETDQRGVLLPQRGTTGTYRMDIGAYEFQEWVVGQAMPRPPSANGKRAPGWAVTDSTSDVARSYGLWSPADYRQYPVRPTRNGERLETATLGWYIGQSDGDTRTIPQVGVIVWPDAPQLHVSGSPVNLSHGGITDGYTISSGEVRTYEGNEPLETASPVVTSNVFRHTIDTAIEGETYSVLPFLKGTQSSGSYFVTVVRTVDWNSAGVRDLRDRVPETTDGYAATDCVIGRELTYPGYTDEAGELKGHSDPEGRPGYLLAGDAYDGVRVSADLSTVRNTVTGLLPPAHVRNLRQGPVIPVLETAPTQWPDDVANPVTGSHDLRVAWYRPDARNIAWPVKTVGYRCRWPKDENAPDIVIASELGSEIGGQELLLSTRYANPTVYNQTDPAAPGYNPNYEHALMAASNLGNTSPALYALRTDLISRDNEVADKSYAVLKFQDQTQNGRIQHRVYQVHLTKASDAITEYSTEPGTISPVSAATAAALAAQEALMGEPAVLGSAAAGQLTFAVSDKSLASDGTVRLNLDALGATNLRGATLTVTYDSSKITPVRCAANEIRVVEAPWNVTVQSEDNVPVGSVVHMRADIAAGTDLRYKWDFDLDDGKEGTFGEKEMSHVYGTAGTYEVQVTVSNGTFDTVALSPVKVVHVMPVGQGEFVALPGDTRPEHCRMPQAGQLVFDLLARNKHGETGDFKLADITFKPAGATFTTPTDVAVAGPVQGAPNVWGPDYRDVSFSITAGNPVYAPVPMRNLLDIQPCEGTQAADIDGEKPLPFWKDWKGMLWARAAEDMDVLYYYPLQTGFWFTKPQAIELGLVSAAISDADYRTTSFTGKCVPWLHKLAAGTLDDPGSDFDIYPVTYKVRWPDLPALLNVGETVYQRAKQGVSAVASQVAVSRIYDDLAQGYWNNDEKKIEVSGSEIGEYLTELIDPLRDVKVELPLRINTTPGLPSVIKTTRLLYGGGLSILGNADDPNLNLPFSLRSRVVFQDSPEDLDGDGETNGTLIFRGYYDGTSAEYIKGDPLLLLNVMSLADKQRLLSLCPASSTADDDKDGIKDCAEYADAIEALYWKTQNPRELDLCRNSSGELPDTTAEPTPEDNRGTRIESISLGCPTQPTAGTYYRDGQPDKAFLIGLQDANDDGMPEPLEGVGKGKALTAGNAAGTGYITLAYNNDSSLGGLPVSLQVVKVQCGKNDKNEESPYRGNLLVIKSDNLFDEKLTLRHTGDFGGRPDNYEFQWWIAAVDDTGVSPQETPPNYPWQEWTRFEPGMDQLVSEITIEGANVTTLRDNWVLVRYKNNRCPVCGNQYRYSAFAGDPSAKPSQVLGQLAEGWIKRVVNALNPFDTRVDDFISSQVSSSVDMVRQAGPRYEGPVAMNADPENLNKMGLIEAYQTVLDRGRALSIDSGINDQGANAALLNVTTRIAQLYMLLGNDAYVDALDPIVGFDDSTLGIRASAVYAFANQYRSDLFGPIDEELALLRGRDETLGGVAAGPTYNRLTWNFTNGEGEVAYVLNYNIADINFDGFIDEADAAIMYPQGHGDAYGQQLTALTTYYQLLKHQNYTWVPRAEPVSVAGAPVVVDYYDERRFAAAAAARARMAAEVVNLTYRKNYAEPEVQPYKDAYVDKSDRCNQTNAPGCNRRAWGVADWAGRSAEGAYFDWVVANAILPPVDDRYADVRKIDRTTVEDIAEISDQLDAIQVQLDRADSGANPLGLQGDAVLFDLDPALTKVTPGSGEGQGGSTHFEQVYEKTIDTVANSLKMFVFANQAKDAQRIAQDEQHDFAADIISEDRAMINELIEIFGYPYNKDIGVNGTYPEGYDGPDIYNYDLIERMDLTDYRARCKEGQALDCRAETETKLVEFPRMDCLGFYVQSLSPAAWTDREAVCPGYKKGEPDHLDIAYTVGVGLDEGRGRYLPESWDGASRKAWGEIQNAMWTVYDTRVAYEQAVVTYDNKLEEIKQTVAALQDRYTTLEHQEGLKQTHENTIIALKTLLLIGKEIKAGADAIWSIATDGKDTGEECVPRIFGLANDVTAGTCPFAFGFTIMGRVAWAVGAIQDMINNGYEYGIDIADLKLELDLFQSESDWELRQMGRELQGKIREERELRLAMFLAADNFGGAQLDYDAAVQKGFRKLKDLVRMRQRWAGQIMDGRYSDMAYRISANDALQKYRQQFDLAQLYTYLTATAYDYETNLSGEDQAAGDTLRRRIIGERSLGELRWSTGAWDLDPIVGSGGLADVLGRLRDNFRVLKGQMGFNNPSAQTSRFSMRQELFRLLDSSDASWRETLQKYYTPNIYANPAVRKLAKKPYSMSGPQPGLVIPFGSVIRQGQNFFTLPLGPGDGAYNPTQFATKIASVGVWFEGYDTNRLARMPYVYLLPAGEDVLRPRNSEGSLRYWNVTEQLLPLPYPITDSDMQNPRWLPGIDGLQGRMYQLKPYAAFQAFPYTQDMDASQMNTDTRLIGRSVWNTEWVLVIPGANLLSDPRIGIDRFMQDVDDIYIYFQTYAYAGTMASPEGTEPSVLGHENVGTNESPAMVDAAAAVPMPQPDAIFYGIALRDGTPLKSGTLTAILPRGDTVQTEIAPITGTRYNYALSVPLGYYDSTDTSYATGFARVGEEISFKINGVPALLTNAEGENYQAYFITSPGTGYTLTVDVSGPGSYPLGDVNVSGKRDAADALMVLKYDVGLAQGVTTWPPGPNTVYVPLCDVTQDGACNSTDALRILMCEVNLAACPARTSLAPERGPALDAALPAYVRLAHEVDDSTGQLVVRVSAESPHTPLAVATFGLSYDPARLAVDACAENPDGRLDMAVCNPAFSADTVRYTGVTLGGIVEATPLVEVRLRALDTAVLEQVRTGNLTLALTDATLFDLNGNVLRPEHGARPVLDHKLYLPTILLGLNDDGGNTGPTLRVIPLESAPSRTDFDSQAEDFGQGGPFEQEPEMAEPAPEAAKVEEQ
jgi:hypothetical protein